MEGKREGTWLRHGFWNTLEHGITRVSDALTSLILLWALAPEVFAKLAYAQAGVAPLLLFFVSPENVIYRDFAQWRAQGPSALACRLRALRLFGWGKIQVAILLALGGALLFPGVESWTSRFFALIWAFSLSLAPQISGADREFLRLDLKLKELNAISVYQKLSLLLGTALVALLLSGRLDLLAMVAAFSAISSAWLARRQAIRVLRTAGATEASIQGREGPTPVATLTESIRSFSIWSHLNGVAANWIQTMDLFFLGIFRFPARELGLYGAALKLANFSQALPLAMANLYSIWVGRQSVEGLPGVRQKLSRLSLKLFAGAVAQGAVLAILAPWGIHLLSHGRWTPEEEHLLYSWFCLILVATIIFTSSFLFSTWLSLRDSVQHLFARVYLPWTLCSLVIYAGAAKLYGASGVAWSNIPVALSFWVLLWISSQKKLSS